MLVDASLAVSAGIRCYWLPIIFVRFGGTRRPVMAAKTREMNAHCRDHPKLGCFSTVKTATGLKYLMKL